MRAAGLQSPDISILSDEFLAEVSETDKKNLDIEALMKLINGPGPLPIQEQRDAVGGASSRRPQLVGSTWALYPRGMRRLSYAGYRFSPEVIHQAIWLYLRFTLKVIFRRV